jgi:2-polyprenyl-3-methyl-5-hydroxy-6-metoxy-1,4-benzoquinol methylase
MAKVAGQMKQADTQQFDYSTDYFEKMASGWNRISFPIIAPFAREGLALFSPESILDVGCGNGIYGNVLRENRAKLFGIDMSPESVELCKSGGYNHVIQCPAQRIEYGDEKFDMVFSSEVLEHVEDYEQMLKEIHRVLKPGGGLILTTTCYCTSIYQFLYNRRGGMRELAVNLVRYVEGFFSVKERNIFVRQWCFESLGGHYHGFIARKLRKSIERIGFDILKSNIFYTAKPFPIVENYNFKQCFFESRRPWWKRLVLLCLLLIAPPVNLVMKTLCLFGQNVYYIARKR